MIGLEGAVFLVAQQRAAVGAVDLAFGGEGVEVAAQRRHGDVQRLFELLQRDGAVVAEKLDDPLPALHGQQRRGIEVFGGVRQFGRSQRDIDLRGVVPATRRMVPCDSL